jgi:Sulfotransferase family
MVEVLFIQGYSRSGSTILGSILGQIDGFTNIGELLHCWRALEDGRGKCGCGKQVVDCEVWTEVFDTSGTSLAGEAIPPAREARRLLQRANSPGRFLRSIIRGHPDKQQLRYARVMADVYTRIEETTKARIIVDTSKDPWFGGLAAIAPGIEVKFVHIVRDPKGVFYSGVRGNPEGSSGPWGRYWMPIRFSVGWVLTNLAAPLAKRLGGTAYHRVVYERFISEPEAELRAILGTIGYPTGSLPLSDESTAILEPSHTIAGNRNRFRTGVVKLLPDQAWSTGLAHSSRLIIDLIAGPVWKALSRNR